jgi:hypothetical protein
LPLWVEPPIGIEPMTYSLRGQRAPTPISAHRCRTRDPAYEPLRACVRSSVRWACVIGIMPFGV